MGKTFQNVVFSMCLSCLIFVTYTVGKGDYHDVRSDSREKTDVEAFGRHPDGSACTCPPCTTGADCSDDLRRTQPKFSIRSTFVEVNVEHERYGVPLPYNHTTYPTDKYCPCNAFEYDISDVENVMEPDDTHRFDLFVIDRKTGQIRLAENRDADIRVSDLYRLTVSVRNVITDASDRTMITVAREKNADADLYSFETDNGLSSGYDSHHIEKRAVSIIPAEVTINQTQTNSVNEVRVGTKVSFEVDIVFPLSSTDISVELFTPDYNTTIMILCDVKVVLKGSNLASTLNGNVTYYAKDGWDVNTAPDMAVMDFGMVTNNGSNDVDIEESTIRIQYNAVMIENQLTQNDTYWVSAGAEYDNEQTIYVSQASFQAVVDGNQDVTLEPEFNITMPANIPLGSSHLVSVEMYIPYPYRDYTFKVFTPADTVGVMSICGIWFDSFGQNFGCGNDVSNLSSATEADVQAPGNAMGWIEFGKLLNKASRDDSIDVQENMVKLYFIMHMFPDDTKVGQLLSLGLSLEVDTDTMLIGTSNFTVDPEVTLGLTDPVFMSVTSSLNGGLDDAIVGQPITLTYDLQVPTPVTSGVASHYILEILAPFDGAAIFSVCSFKVIYVGQKMPCVKTDDLVTKYSSRVVDGSGIEADRAVIDIGHVINLLSSNDVDADIIRVEAIVKPLASHASTVVPSTHTVSLGVQVGTNSMTLASTDITIAAEQPVTLLTSSTAPEFTMAFDGSDNVPVTGSAKVLVNMTTSRNITYETMHMEFLMPNNNDSSYFHLCRVDIISNGKNMPCMTPEWYGELMQYTSSFDNYEIDQAKLPVGSMCNYQFEDDVVEDVTSFAFYLKVLNRPDLLHMTSKWLSMGLQYSPTNLWVGQLNLYATTGVSVAPTKSVYDFLTRNTTTTPTPIGSTVSYSLMVKIGRGDTAHLQVIATAQNEGAHICTVRMTAAGSNLPCAVDEVGARTYTDWPSGSGRREVEYDAGFVTNYGSTDENMIANDYFDGDTMIIEIVVRANPTQPAGTFPVDIVLYYDTDRTQTSPYARTDFVTTEALPTDTSIPESVEGTLSVGEITGDSDSTTDIAISEAKRVLFTAVIPEESNYDLEMNFIIPVADVGKIEICDAAIVSVGDNLPCIDVLTEAEITSDGGVYNDSATFNLGYTCNRPMRPGDQKANSVVFEAYFRALPNVNVAVDETVSITASLRTFTTVTTDAIQLTVTDPSLFVDRAISIDGVTNETMIALDVPEPLVLGISENKTITATVSVLERSVSRFLFDVDLPTSDSACLTINDIRVIGSVGRNVLCLPPEENSKGIVYTPSYNSTFGTSQQNYMLLDLGIVTNTGLTHRRGTFAPGDDDVKLEIDIQMADCDISHNGTVHKLSVGHSVSARIVILEHDVEVFRDGNEKPEICLELNAGVDSTSTVIYAEGTVSHSSASTAEGKNTSIFVSLPAYQLAPNVLYKASNQTCDVVSIAENSALLQILCENFFFTDVFTFTAEILVNDSVIIPVGFSGDDSVAQGWVGTYYNSRYVTYDTEDWFPYPNSCHTEMQYGVVAGIDTSSLSGLGLDDNSIVDDCQIISSTGNVAPAANVRISSAEAWCPYVRYGKFAPNRYLAVYFGNLYRFSKMLVQQDLSHAALVTDMMIEYTEDGRSWYGEESVSLNPSVEENVTLSGRQARGVRVSLTNDTAYGTKADIGVQFELYGSQLTSNVSKTDACNTLAASQFSVPAGYPTFGARSFVEDISSGTVYVCDRKVDRKIYRGECKTSADAGVSWEKLHQVLECMIGFETSNNRVYAYARERKIMMSEDDGPWLSVPFAVLEEDRVKLTWTNAIIVQEQATPELDRITPHSMYRIQQWSATIEGMYKSNVINMRWTAEN